MPASLEDCNVEECNAFLKDWIVDRYWAVRHDFNYHECDGCPRRGFRAPFRGWKEEENRWVPYNSKHSAFDNLKHKASPVNCVGKWERRGDCSAPCADEPGQETEEFKITRQAAHNGQECEAKDGATRRVECRASNPCPVDCEYTITETECNATCDGPGTYKKIVNVTRNAEHGGQACPENEEIVCDQVNECCYTDIEGEDYGECDRICDGGMQEKKQQLDPDINHGIACSSERIIERECNTHECQHTGEASGSLPSTQTASATTTSTSSASASSSTPTPSTPTPSTSNCNVGNLWCLLGENFVGTRTPLRTCYSIILCVFFLFLGVLLIHHFLG